MKWVKQVKKEPTKPKTKFTKEDREEMKAVSKMYGAIRYMSDNTRGFFNAYYSKTKEQRERIIERFTEFAEEIYR